ncbi:hypothetical protein C2S53_002464 [Perilla frutescens var. hirtella]|uniref:Late embryogenesis abundant protein LEA-2 subgroup domain-containing protein n=1 Tax=Perilla frutescens var. hirtella TaxID=608512 RepID=A0AAD4IPQ2_PERFH|nr:hypothetical protein C2S53_002464 [Perilla frutescens var. hirtella]
MERSEQVRPLAPASSNAEDVTKNRRRRWLWCCACVGAALLILAVVVVILIFIVFKAKEPVFRVNRVTVDRLEVINGTTTPRPGTNMSLTVDVSVKNRNYVSFSWHQNTTSALFYRGTAIGEAHVPGEKSRARRTMRMNVTVDVILDRIMGQPDLGSDISTGLVTVGTYTEVDGKVKLLMIKKHVRVKMNCSMTINISSPTPAIQKQDCKHKVKL